MPYQSVSVDIGRYGSQYAPMSVIDLQARYGQMVPLADLAELFHANQRAMRAALDKRDVPIFEIGNSIVVPLRLVEEVFRLTALLDDDARHLAALERASRRADGSPKSADEYAAEVDARAQPWLDDIEQARAASGVHGA